MVWSKTAWYPSSHPPKNSFRNVDPSLSILQLPSFTTTNNLQFIRCIAFTHVSIAAEAGGSNNQWCSSMYFSASIFPALLCAKLRSWHSCWGGNIKAERWSDTILRNDTIANGKPVDCHHYFYGLIEEKFNLYLQWSSVTWQGLLELGS